MKNVKEVVQSGLCISCGLCQGLSADPATALRENRAKGGYLPITPSVDPDGEEFHCCPGRGYPIEAMATELFPEAPRHDVALGRYREFFACYYNDADIAAGATSGGVMTGIARHLLETGRVHAVVTTRTIPTEWGPRSETFLARSTADLISAQGSKYCPTPALVVLRQMEEAEGPIAFIGTPCQVAALRNLQARREHLKHKVYLTIANFCGGFRDLRETDRLISRSGLKPSEVAAFRYRGGGQPGSMQITDRNGKSVELPYPEYARRTGFIKHKRCRLCVDATGELADISCGDAWLDRFITDSPRPWSLAVVRSEKAQAIADELTEHGLLVREAVTCDEVKRSQAGNLASKKHRFDAKHRFHRLLRQRTPEFDGGFHRTNGGFLTELRAFGQQHVFHYAERLGLYPMLAKLLRRY